MRLAATPRQNHWWNVAFTVGVRGLTTGRMVLGDTSFELTLDLVDHALVARTEGVERSFALHDGLAVAAFHERLFELLGSLGIDVVIRPEPFGVPITTLFPEDVEHASYDRDAVERFWRALAWSDWILREFAGWFTGKTSPVHVFWHSFDLALTGFSGRRAPALPGADEVTREAYSHEAISFGFWARDAPVRRPAFYSYAVPEPAGLTERPLAEGATWVSTGSSSQAILPYDDVRTAADPRAVLLAFLQSAYEAGVDAAGWPAEELRSGWAPPSGGALTSRSES